MDNRTKIATAATVVKKANKKAAFDILLSIIDSEERPSDIDLAALYSFFLPPVTKIKTPFDWLVKARANKDVRYYLNYVFSDGKRSMATNGHTLHVIDSERVEGFYNDAGQRVDNGDMGKFPDIDRVIPENDGTRTVLNVSELKLTVSVKTTCYIMPDGYGMNKTYLDNAIGLSNDYEITYKDSRCLINHKAGGLAVVMGIRL